MGIISLKEENLVFIGLSGSGKTTFGKFAAKKLNKPFIDTDCLIEETAGKSIAKIFSEDGEKAFRSLEKKIIDNVSSMKNIVIATGGGAWLEQENREKLRKNGIVIYLACALDELWERLKKDVDVRPLLKEGFSSLKNLHRKRHEKYEKADYIIDTSGKSFEDIWLELIEKIDLKQTTVHSYSNHNITKLTVETSSASYPILIGYGAIRNAPRYIEEKYCKSGENRPKVFLITNPFVNAICGVELCNRLKEKGFQVDSFIVPDGEEYKTLAWAEKSYSALIEAEYDRGDIIVALGGGVIGDLGGFVAATYMRGLPVIQLPTTLLAQVDSSVGGKTAVNLPQGKNLVGVFYQPDLVISDSNLLKHLSEDMYRNGLAECVKYGVLSGEELFNFFEKNADPIKERDPLHLVKIISECCKIKGKIVREDEKEKGMRAVLNLGHTIGHALEAAAGYGVLGHGDAVALGMRAESYMSMEMGLLGKKAFLRIESLLNEFRFPKKIDLRYDIVFDFLKRDKKRKRADLIFVLPKDIGCVEIKGEIKSELIKAALQYIGVDNK